MDSSELRRRRVWIAVGSAIVVLAIAFVACGPPTRSNVPTLQQLPDAAVRDAPGGPEPPAQIQP